MPLSVMQPLGVCSWSLRATNPTELIARVKATGLSAVQLALTPLVESPTVWCDVFRRMHDEGIAVVSGMLETVGEDYSSIERIALTGGVRPDATWAATRERALRVADVAARHGLELVTFHAGFLPHDRADPERSRMIERLRDMAELFATQHIAIAFETGQEPAATLIDCLQSLDAPSVGVNFDPANMLLYGSGDPIDALVRLAPWVRQAHVKDALPSALAGVWGTEVPVGTGLVDWRAFLSALSASPHRPRLVIEREAEDARIDDIRAAKTLLDRLALG